MIIEQILNSKGRAVTTVADRARLRDAARLLDDARIGAVVAIADDGGVTGVLSERDVVRQVARQGQAALEMAVSGAMTREVITATPLDTLDD